ncbi:MAG: glycosyltransferase [Dermatophilaceae bacterium]
MRVLLEGLATHGIDVVECNVPLGFSTAERVEMLRKPWRLSLLLTRLARNWLQLVVLSTRMRRRSRPDAVLVGYLGHFDVFLARFLFPHTRIVLDHLIFAGDTAKDRGSGGGWRGRVLNALDRAAIAQAAIIVCDTQEHAGLVPVNHRSRAVVVPVGADGSWFRAGDPATRTITAADDSAGQLSVIFFGLMTPLQGAPVLAAALRELDGAVRATVVGSGQDSAEVDLILRGVPGVERSEWVDPAQLPELVASHDLCLGIFGKSPKAQHVVPNKVYQGAAAGCLILTSDTPPQRRALHDSAVLVPPGDSVALARALRELADDPARVARLREVARRTVRDEFSPHAVTSSLARRLEGRL